MGTVDLLKEVFAVDSWIEKHSKFIELGGSKLLIEVPGPGSVRFILRSSFSFYICAKG